VHQLRIPRANVDGVIEAPGGAHFTSCDPDYGRDETFQRAYAKSAASPEAWAEFRAAWIDVSEAEYQQRRAAGAAT
jgi:glutaconate CoA-transferase subunit A